MELWLERKRALAYPAAFLFALLLGLLASFFYERNAFQGRVVRGVTILGHPVSGLDRMAVERHLSARQKKFREIRLELALGKEHKQFSTDALGLSLDVGAAKRAALSTGRRGSWFGQFGFWLGRLVSPVDLSLSVAAEKGKLKGAILPWARMFLQEPALPSISYEGDTLRVDGGKGGTVIEYEALSLALMQRASELRESEKKADPEPILVPTTQKSPTVSPEEVERAQKRAAALIAGPIVVVAPEGEEQVKLSPSVIGRALVSKVDEAAGRISLEVSTDALKKPLKKLLGEWQQPALDASFTFSGTGQPTVVASEEGRGLDEVALQKAFLNVAEGGPRQFLLPLTTLSPKLSTDQAEKLGIKGLVMSFTTRHACCQPRVENIHRAAKQLDGVVLLPGEKFSLNDFLGPRRKSTGYHKAPTIVKGEMEDVYGGGISQLATTLFNAVLRGGYEIIQRQPHSVYFSRYPEGHEATVSFPQPDLIFRNDTEAGMVIKTNAAPTFISVLVYGDTGGRITTVDKGRRYNVVQPPKEYEPDETMEPQKVKRLRAGQLGWTVLVSRKVKYPNGETKEEKREVVYNPRPELLRLHPCMIPEGEEGHTGEECPEPEIVEEEEELSEEGFFETQ